MIGPPALPALTALLDNADLRTDYEGSEEATVGNMARYRVKDFAAFYIAQIKNMPLPFYPDFVRRDEAIAQLKF